MKASERFNIYTGIHKGLRACMSEVLLQVGRLDPNDAEEVRAAMAAVRELIGFANGHLRHENEWIHPALEACRPGASVESQADHARHLESFALLEASVRAVESSAPGGRAEAALRLYRQLALFVAENFEHMHVEETENHATLIAGYSDAEVRELDRRLVASVKPELLMTALRWMVPGLGAPQRAELLGAMQASAPRPVFDAVLERVRPHLGARDWAKLGAALGPMPLPAARAEGAGRAHRSAAAEFAS